MISAALASILLAGVLSTFVMMGRTGANMQNYTELEAQARKALELFSREVRLAYAVTAYSSTSVTLSIPDTSSARNAFAYSVTYTFDSANKKFTRTGPPIDNPAGTSASTDLITNVQPITGVNPLNYYRFVTGGGYQNGFTSNTAANSTEIKQVELNFVAQRQSTTVAAATDKVLSARYILRNK
jgi:Tfp pilus assembly protein PilW